MTFDSYLLLSVSTGESVEKCVVFSLLALCVFVAVISDFEIELHPQ